MLTREKKLELLALLDEKQARADKVRASVDFEYFAHTRLKIRPKEGALMPFTLNRAQRYINSRLDEQIERLGRVRVLILKGRQQGATTLIGARFYWKVTKTGGFQCFILTHEAAATDKLFKMVERYHKNDPYAQPTSASNSKELSFSALDSGYSVGTAGTKGVGRSSTIQLFHGSEVAFWPNASEHFAAVVQGVPKVDGSEIILESTANGIGGEFHKRWQEAEAGKGEYQAIFVPWFWSDEYTSHVPFGFVLDDEEAEYQALHELSLEQISWRRDKIVELGSAQLFKQEYPATAAEAFQTTGHDAFIDTELVMVARKREIEGLGSLVVGMDPAGQGDDATAVAWRRGNQLIKTERRYKLTAVDKANWVRTIIDEDEPAKVFIDVGGGYGEFIQIVRDWGKNYDRCVEAVSFGGGPQDPPKIGSDGTKLPSAKNRRAEMWMRMKTWLQDPLGVDIPDEDALHADLCAPGYRHNTARELILESKEDIKKRGMRSPDAADALALTFAAPVKVRIEEPARTRYASSTRRRASAWAV